MSLFGRSSQDPNEEDSSASDWVPPAARAAVHHNAQSRMSATASQSNTRGENQAQLATSSTGQSSSIGSQSPGASQAYSGHNSGARSLSSSQVDPACQVSAEAVETATDQPAPTQEVFLWRPGQGQMTTRKPVLPRCAPRTSPTSPKFSSQLPGSHTSLVATSKGQSALNDLSQPSCLPTTSASAAIREECIQCGQLEQKLQTQQEHFNREQQRLNTIIEGLRVTSSEFEGQQAGLRDRINELEEELRLKSQTVERLEEEKTTLQESNQLQLQEKDAELVHAREQASVQETSLTECQEECQRLRAELQSSQEENAELSQREQMTISDMKLLRSERDELLIVKQNLEEQLQEKDSQLANQGSSAAMVEEEGKQTLTSGGERALQQGIQQQPKLVNGTPMSQQAILKQLVDCQAFLQSSQPPSVEQLQQLQRIISCLQTELQPESAGTSSVPGHQLSAQHLGQDHQRSHLLRVEFAEQRGEENMTSVKTRTSELRQAGVPQYARNQTLSSGQLSQVHYGGSTTGHPHYGPSSMQEIETGVGGYQNYPNAVERTVHATGHAEPDMYSQSPQVAWEPHSQPYWPNTPSNTGSELPFRAQQHNQSSQVTSYPPSSHREWSVPSRHPRTSSGSSQLSQSSPMNSEGMKYFALSSPETPSAWPLSLGSSQFHPASPEAKQQQLPKDNFQMGDEVQVCLQSEWYDGAIRYIGPLKGSHTSAEVLYGVELEYESE